MNKSGKIEYPKSLYANIFHTKINEKNIFSR